MSKSVFISHAVKDSKIAEQLVELLEGGVGVPEEEIFCSSLDGYGIPTGKNFVTHIKGQIQKPEVVILLLTPSYFSSNFCLSELGASWAMSHDTFPILVPPLKYEDVKDVLLGTQLAKIEDDIKYNELRDCLLSKVECDKKSNTKWDTKRKSYLSSLKPLLKKISLPEIISTEEHAKLGGELEECQEELLKYEDETQKLKHHIKELESLKDAEQIKAIKKKHSSRSIAEEFEELVDSITEVSGVLPKEVFKFVLCEYYSQPYSINHYEYGDEFSEAARYKYISLEDGEAVNWANKKMKKLENLLQKLHEMVEESDDIEDLESYHEDEYDLSVEPDNQGFWETHYKI